MIDKLLSIPEAAQQLGVSRFTIRAWVQSRKIKHYKLGRRVLISPEALGCFLAERLIFSATEVSSSSGNATTK